MVNLKQNKMVLTIVINDNSLCFIFAQKEYKKPYKPIYYKTFFSTAYQIDGGLFYNYSVIKHELFLCITTHNLRPGFIIIVADNKQLSQNFVVASQPIPYASKGTEYFNYAVQAEHTHYIGPCDEIDHLLCKCAITDYALLQYQLLIIPFRMPLLSITCPIHALLYAYQGYKGAAFRLSEFVQESIKYNNNMVAFFTEDMLHRLIPNVLFENSDTKKALLFSYGSMIYQELLYG